MVAKQAWRILENPSSLVTRILRARYFPDGNFLGAELGNSPSLVWRSIVWGRQVVEEGLVWSIGDGQSVRVFQDKWIPKPYTFRPLLNRGCPVDARVADFITASGTWNLEVLDQFFCEEDSTAISQIPLASVVRAVDQQYWFFTKNGKYTVKSGYRIALRLCDMDSNNEVGGSATGAQQAFWKRLWSLEVPNKVKLLLWRAVLNILPTSLNLFQKKVIHSPLCTSCGKRSEDALHALWNCKRSRKLWSLTPFVIDLDGEIGSFADFFEGVALRLSGGDLERFACLVWRAWKLRNDKFHGKQVGVLSDAIEQTIDNLEQFKAHSGRMKPTPVARHIRWIKPPPPKLLLNCDGAIGKGGSQRGLGGVLRDSTGAFVWGFACGGLVGLDVVATECAALRVGLMKAAELGLYGFILATDSQEVVNLLKAGGETRSNIRNMVDDIQLLTTQLEIGGVVHQPRQGNGVAHSLAQFGLKAQTFCFWECIAPSWLSPLLEKDRENS